MGAVPMKHYYKKGWVLILKEHAYDRKQSTLTYTHRMVINTTVHDYVVPHMVWEF